MLQTLVCAVLATATPAYATVPQAAPAETRQAARITATARLDAVIDRAIAEKRIVGTVVIVMQDGAVVYQRAAGFADRDARTPMRSDTIFRLASISKPVVSAALMRLVEEGRLSLDDPVTRWLPDFQPHMPDGTTPVITLRQLLTHSSGLSYRFIEPAGSAYDRLNVSDGLDQPGLGLAENLERLEQAPLVYAPGTSWRYSLGIDVLGGVIAKASGKSLPETVAETVTKPLGMIDTGFSVTDLERLAIPYADGTPQPEEITDGMAVPLGDGVVRFAPGRALDPSSYPSGGGGMVGTAGDIVRFLEAVRTGGGPILAPSTVADMMTDHIGPSAQTQGPGWGFGYGWAVLDDPEVGHTPQAKGTIQWGGAYGHSWFVDPVHRLTVVALTNTTFEGMSGAFPGEVRDAVYGGAVD